MNSEHNSEQVIAYPYSAGDEELWEPESRQFPHPYSDEWNDPLWRERWLNGLSDDQLKLMSPAAKGYELPAYWWSNGYDHYGPDAEAYMKGCRLLETASIAIDRLTPGEITRLGHSTV